MSASQSVDSQSTTDDETCSDGGLMNKLQKDMERLMDSQQQLLQQHQRDIERLFHRVGKLQSINCLPNYQ